MLFRAIIFNNSETQRNKAQKSARPNAHAKPFAIYRYKWPKCPGNHHQRTDHSGVTPPTQRDQQVSGGERGPLRVRIARPAPSRIPVGSLCPSPFHHFKFYDGAFRGGPGEKLQVVTATFPAINLETKADRSQVGYGGRCRGSEAGSGLGWKIGAEFA